MNDEQNSLARRQAEGLYEPSTERAACGVGFVVHLHGQKSHDIVRKGIEILVNLTHRGGCGCDPRTGDGAGILTQIPHDFFVEECAELGITLPAPGEYGAGFLFLPRLANEGVFCQNRLIAIIREEGQEFLGWRTPPTDRSSLGWIAQDVEPYMKQVFIARGKDTPADMFEWKLYVIRKRIEMEVRSSRLFQKAYFYVPSLSSRTIVYKGLMLTDAVDGFYPDLKSEKFVSALALVHQRFSTNTFPSWDLAQPFRYLAHNGEINTLRGNVNWMRARESMFASEKYGADLKKLGPICTPNASDTAIFDNTLELLVVTGRSLTQAMTMMIPEPWDHHETMSEEKKAYYEYQACLMEPWDGPACIAFTDGTCMGASLDRNGLRPSRYWVMKDGLVVMASEAGVLQIPPANVAHKGRLQPGRMFLVDTQQGRIVSDDEIKHGIASRKPYREWLDKNQKPLAKVMEKYNAAKGENGKSANGHANGHGENGAKDGAFNGFSDSELTRLQRTFGYTLEDLRVLIQPMAETGGEAIGSMGTDTPLAVLSERPQLLYAYFKQLFAQVTNPPLDAIREEVVTSLVVTLGSEGNLLEETPEQARLLRIDQPILLDKELAAIKQLNEPGFKSRTLSMLYSKVGGKTALKQRLDELKAEASKAVEDGVTILILSDRGVTDALVPVPSLLATGCVHHHLTREGTRSHCGLIVESGEPREVHHFALLVGFGAGAVNPYLAFATIRQMQAEGIVSADKAPELLDKNFAKAGSKGVLKVMSKMGISTLQSYRGSQIFEAVGIDRSVIDEYFVNTPSRIQGIGLETIALENELRHSHGWPAKEVPQVLDLDVGGHYSWRRKGEYHLHNPDVVAKLQQATKINSAADFKKYCQLVDEQQEHLCTLRGLLRFKFGADRVPLAEVEPVSDIVKRFATGAMSFGSISKEAHETLAIAMNRIGAKSNTGEGGEDSARFLPDENGDRRRSAIKQVASGRFGVTSEYLVNSDELQIKMAQGAKPGEGGQLPGAKVDEFIGKVRHSTPGVGLISPPPHHDIYSIEDLAQLIHDLKNANHYARVAVKLVAEVGVGTVAAGVAKGKADVVLVSGFDGGTGASPQTSIKHAGLPWELGVAETHQVLLKNDLRSRVVLQTDGQIRTPKDVVIAALLGAEEWGVATAALVVSGCIMMRKCHLNTCPVGIATQDPELRKKFAGKPEYVVNFFFMLAEGVREIMADLGVRTINELIGRVDLLEIRKATDHWKARGLDLSPLLVKPRVNESYGTFCSHQQDHEIEKSLDMTKLLDLCAPALDERKQVKLELPIRNINRTVGTILSSEITRKHGRDGLPEDTIQIHFRGTAGQSCLAFGAPGVTFRFEGDVNDYVGKGLSGGKIIVFPDRESTLVAEDNIIAGNVALYGATAGQLYIRGVAGERFCVRNSGADAVVEGVGDHGCEYMTGGNVVVLGRTGRNFAAGMSGGVAYVYDLDGRFKNLVNMEMVAFEELDAEDVEKLQTLIGRHIEYTDSARGKMILADWPAAQAKFVKIMPVDYRKALDDLKKKSASAEPVVFAGVTK